MPHCTNLRVRFGELDPYGHVNHSVYVGYFEVGRVEALAEVGMGLDRLQRDLGVNMVVVEIHTRFVASAVLGDDLVVESGLRAVGRAKATWAQRVRRGAEVLATQVMLSACTTAAGRPTRFPAELVEALEPFRVTGDWLGSSAPRGPG